MDPLPSPGQPDRAAAQLRKAVLSQRKRKRALAVGVTMWLLAVACGPLGRDISAASQAGSTANSSREPSLASVEDQARTGGAGDPSRDVDAATTARVPNDALSDGSVADALLAATPEPKVAELGTFTVGHKLSSWSLVELVVGGRSSASPPFEPAVLRDLDKDGTVSIEPRSPNFGASRASVMIVIENLDALAQPDDFDRILDLHALWPRWKTTDFSVVLLHDGSTASALVQMPSVRRLLRRVHAPILLIDASTTVQLAAVVATDGGDELGVKVEAPSSTSNFKLPTIDKGTRPAQLCRVVVIDRSGTVALNDACSLELAPLETLLTPPP